MRPTLQSKRVVMRRIAVCLLGWLAIGFHASAYFTDLESSMEGSAKNVPIVRMCSNASLLAGRIADFFSEQYWGKKHNFNSADNKFLEKKRELENEIEQSSLPLAQKIRLQGLVAVLWNATFENNINPAEVTTNYYLHCMDMAYK